MKKYISTFTQLKQTPISQRRHFYLDRDLIASIKVFTHGAEPMLGRKVIETSGIIVAPFWEDTNALDEEGIAFQKYMMLNPNFEMMIRKKVLKKLLDAQKLLPKNWQIVLKAGFRPLIVQKMLFEEVVETEKSTHPDWDHDTLYRHCLTYVTDPDKYISPHATGGAVDILTIDKKSGEIIDMGSPINAVGDASWCDFGENFKIKQVKNRDILISTMIRAGFANLASEWWHFSYGDPRWAIFYDQKVARYPHFDSI